MCSLAALAKNWNNGCASQMFRLVPVFGNKPKHLTLSVTGSEYGYVLDFADTRWGCKDIYVK